MSKPKDEKQLELFADEQRQIVERWMEARDSTLLKFSYQYITTEFQRLPIYGKRIFYLLVLHAYHKMALEGQTLDKNFTVGEWADDEVELNIRDILASDKDTNYNQVKEYVKGVMTAVTQETNESGDVRLSHFIQSADFEHKGRIILRIDRRNWQRILDFARGFKEGELEVLMYAKGEYTPLAYLLFSSQATPILFSIGFLRRVFLGENSTKYPKNNDFMRNVIEAPMKELDRYSPNSFKFWPAEDAKGGGSGRGRPKKDNYYFVGVRHLDNESGAWKAKELARPALLDREVFQTLKNKYYFEREHFSVHKDLLVKAEKMLGADGLLKFLGDNAVNILRADKPPLYAIGTLKRYLANKENKDRLASLAAATPAPSTTTTADAQPPTTVEESTTMKDLKDPHEKSIGDIVVGKDLFEKLL